MGAGGGGGGGKGGWEVASISPLYLRGLTYLQFTVNTLAATYLLGFFSPKINSRKVPDVDQPRRTRENKIVLTTGSHGILKQVGDRTTA